jgi:hypothetical protein
MGQPNSLSANTWYYWRVDEINNSDGNVSYKGAIWDFNNLDYFVIDDFNTYTTTDDLNQAWKSGYQLSGNCGLDEGEYGAVYAYITNLSWYYGTMRYDYNNINGGTNPISVYFSEANRPYADGSVVDWKSSSILANPPALVTLDYQGRAGNSADPNYDRMYAAVEDRSNNFGIVLNPDEDAPTRVTWQTWNIPLTDFNNSPNPAVNLSNLRSFFIGFGQRCNFTDALGGAGRVSFDNIYLRSRACNPSYAKEQGLTADITGNCIVDICDVDALAFDWLISDTNYTYDQNRPPTNGPVLWYKFDDAAGSTVTDSSGRSNDGTLPTVDTTPTLKATTWEPTGGHDGSGCINMMNNAANAWASATWIQVPPGAYDANTGAATFTWWEYYDVNVDPGSWASVFTMFDSGGVQLFEAQVPTPWITANQDFGPAVRFVSPLGTQVFSTGRRHLQEFGGRWNHFALVVDSVNDSVRCYLGGFILADINNWTGSMWAAPSTFTIASRSPVTGGGSYPWGFWPGKLDDFRIYNYALDVNEIAYIATDGTGHYYEPLYAPATDLVPSGASRVNFRDYAVLADQWMLQVLWP